MPELWRSARLVIILIILLSSVLFVIGCSDTKTTEPESSDNTAPVVVSFNPSGGETNVALNANIEITFSEAINQTTAAAGISISSGSITGLTWVSNNVVHIAHSPWVEATEITVTVATSVKDLAGNNLSRAFSTDFFTLSTAVVILSTDPASGATNITRNVRPVLQFSHEMITNSVRDAITISETPAMPKAIPTWNLDDLDGDNRYRIIFDEPLTALSTYIITVGVSATTQHIQDHLAAETSFSFTVGSEIDSTSPEITSVSPAVGATTTGDVGLVTINFSEPIDPDEFDPSRLAGHFMTYSINEPSWNPAGDQMTLYLGNNLPTGVRFFAVFGVGSFRDLAGNTNTIADSLSFTTSGTADFYPVVPNLYFYFTDESSRWNPTDLGSTNTDDLSVTYGNIDGELFERIVRYDGSMDSDTWRMRKSGINIRFRGYEDDGEWAMFNPEINYVPQPVPTTWSGTSTLTTGTETSSLIFRGVRLDTDITLGPFGDEPPIYIENCTKVELYHGISATPGGELVAAGTDTIWLAPGLGDIQSISYEENFDSTPPSWSRHVITLESAQFDLSR